MNKQVGQQDSRNEQQGGTPDLRSRYRAIGIPAISAATLCKGRKDPAPQQQGQSQGMTFEYED
jgi:hypothetical protein